LCLNDLIPKWGQMKNYIEIANNDEGWNQIKASSAPEGIVVLHEFVTMSSRDRHWLLLRLDEITSVDAGAQYEEDIKLLANYEN
jgi:hypothetical protein